MKRSLIFWIFITICISSKSQVQIIDNDSLKNAIVHSEKPYKLIYILCDYCQPSVERFPELLKILKENTDVALFPICAQDSQEIAAYLKRASFAETIYLINQKRKNKIISFYNPIKFTCKYLNKQLGISTEMMGASDYCLLDKDNNLILQTNWDMPDSLYFNQLKEFLWQKKEKVARFVLHE